MRRRRRRAEHQTDLQRLARTRIPRSSSVLAMNHARDPGVRLADVAVLARNPGKLLLGLGVRSRSP